MKRLPFFAVACCLTLACGGPVLPPGPGSTGSTSGGSTGGGSSSGTGSTSGSASGGSTGGGASGGATGGGTSGGSTSSGTTGGGGDTWTNWASPDFFQSYCVSCHTPGGQGDPSGSNLDFTQYANVATNAATIRCGVAVTQDAAWNCTVAAEQFPIGSGPHPTAPERDRLVAWIDAGMPE
ncbi:MAG TPA: hypothetical protein VMB50_02705 [Myxococcales bacterium]|nr:hypothetical protein [Myxococcales bacterium]